MAPIMIQHLLLPPCVISGRAPLGAAARQWPLETGCRKVLACCRANSTLSFHIFITAAKNKALICSSCGLLSPTVASRYFTARIAISEITAHLCLVWSIKIKLKKNRKCMKLCFSFCISASQILVNELKQLSAHFSLSALCTWLADSNHGEGSPPSRHLCLPSLSQPGHHEATAAPPTDPGRRRCTAEAGGPHGRPAASGWGWAGRGATPEVHLEREKSTKKDGKVVM